MMGIKQGTTVFTEDGNGWEYIATLGDGSIVLRAIYDEDEEHWYSRSTCIVEKVWPKPPRQIHDVEIAQRVAEIAKLRAENNELARERRELERDIPNRIAALAQLDAAVTRIDDFMAGKITHFVTEQRGRFKIEALEDALKSDERNWPVRQKLITLFGRSDGSLSWNINQYSDGSGHSAYRCYPCKSAAEALAVMAPLIAAMLADKEGYGRSSAMDSADKYGLPVPASVRAELMARDRVRMAKNVEDHSRRLAGAQKTLDEHDAKTLEPS